MTPDKKAVTVTSWKGNSGREWGIFFANRHSTSFMRIASLKAEQILIRYIVVISAVLLICPVNTTYTCNGMSEGEIRDFIFMTHPKTTEEYCIV